MQKQEKKREVLTYEKVKDYYGKILKTNRDLKTNACCPVGPLPGPLQDLLSLIHPEIKEKFYGCGAPFPPLLEGATVLDLGCGSGRDTYLLSHLVGPKGRVIGVDMTEGQVECAKKFQEWQARQFHHEKSNVEFKLGYIEDLESHGLKNESIDVVVSNCVLNLSPFKERVFSEIFRVLKPGGELYFSDVFSGRRIPPDLREDRDLLGECLGGALYLEDFRRLLLNLGWRDPRQMSSSPLEIQSGDIRKKIGMVDFYSRTFRVFKCDLEDRCEDYGQIGLYRGTIPGLPHEFLLDDHHLFQTGRPLLICGNTADMLQQSRYAGHFTVMGDKSRHFGLFDCGEAPPAQAGASCC